jgi:hypothetical protein
VANERIAALLEDRKVREQEWGRHRANYELQVKQLTDKLRRAEEVLRQTTKEAILGARRWLLPGCCLAAAWLLLLGLGPDSGVMPCDACLLAGGARPGQLTPSLPPAARPPAARREVHEAQAASATAAAELQQHTRQAAAELGTARRQHEQQLAEARQAADAKMREYVDKFRQQVGAVLRSAAGRGWRGGAWAWCAAPAAWRAAAWRPCPAGRLHHGCALPRRDSAPTPDARPTPAQVRAREEELVQLAAVHSAAKAQYEGRAAELEARAARLAAANAALELRRARDAEGCAADISALRKQLAAIDRRLLQMRLVERLEDNERLDRLLDQLEGKAAAAEGGAGGGGGGGGAGRLPGRPGSSGGGSVKSAMSGQLAAARGRLAELEGEMARRRGGGGGGGGRRGR